MPCSAPMRPGSKLDAEHGRIPLAKSAQAARAAKREVRVAARGTARNQAASRSRLTKDRWRSRVSGAGQAHLGNVGWDRASMKFTVARGRKDEMSTPGYTADNCL